MLVDTHLHIIDKSRLRYPWLAEVPALDRDFLYAEYERQVLRAGISDAIHMEVDVAPDDIEAEIAFAGEQSRQPGSLIRGCIAACRPEEPGFAALVEPCHRKFRLGPRGVGQRLAGLHAGRRAAGLDQRDACAAFRLRQ